MSVKKHLNSPRLEEQVISSPVEGLGSPLALTCTQDLCFIYSVHLRLLSDLKALEEIAKL